MIRSTDAHTGADAPLDPQLAAELEALDAALRGEAIDDEALATLVRDVRAQAPEMPTELRRQLGDDVAAGFPRFGKAGAQRADRRPGAERKAPRRGRRTLLGSGLAAAAACCVLVVVIGVAGSGGGSEDSATNVADVISGQSQADEATVDQESNVPRAPSVPPSNLRSESVPPGAARESSARPAPSSSSGSSASPSSASADSSAASSDPATSTPATGKRRVEQAVDMSVRVKSGELDEAAGKVGDITRRAGGFVADSRVTTRSRGAGTATYTLQVASSKLDQAIGALSDLGTVTRQDQQSTDITSSFDTVGQRLRDAKAVRRALLRSLDKADSAGQIASLRSRIADNRKTIAGLESEVLQLERRTNLTTIGLTLRAPSGDAPDTDDDGSWSIGDALADAGDVLQTTGGVLLVGGAVLLPFALLGGLGWGVYRVRRHRRREAALDA